jgi:FkbM family methyltransferase
LDGGNLSLVQKKILDFKMCLDTKDEGISKELIEHGIRERFSVDYITKILRPDMNVLEIGANIGFYSLIEAPIVKHIYAIEPVKYNFNLLKKNIELNKLKNIDTYKCAIGALTGLNKIYTSKRCNWATIVDERHRTPDYQARWDRFKKGYEVVDIYKLDDFTDRNAISKIDFIRMDVEGAEVDIVAGGLETIRRMKQDSWLVMEIHSSCIKIKESIENMLNRITDAGFVCDNIMTKHKVIDLDKVADIKDFLTYKVGCPQVFFKKC